MWVFMNSTFDVPLKFDIRYLDTWQNIETFDAISSTKISPSKLLSFRTRLVRDCAFASSRGMLPEGETREMKPL